MVDTVEVAVRHRFFVFRQREALEAAFGGVRGARVEVNVGERVGFREEEIEVVEISGREKLGDFGVEVGLRVVGLHQRERCERGV